MDIFDIRVVASINIINFLVTKLFGALPVFCSVLFCCISGSVAQPSGNYIVFIKMVFTFSPPNNMALKNSLNSFTQAVFYVPFLNLVNNILRVNMLVIVCYAQAVQYCKHSFCI